MRSLPFEVEQALLVGAFNPRSLTKVEVKNLGADDFEAIRDSVEPKGCYRNAIRVGQMLGAEAEAVVFGPVYSKRFEVAFEHAWIRLADGTYCDPTYQSLDGGI
ncbi:MAG: hypothetical protein ACRC1W_13480, partial [Shewanella sp.]